MVEDILKMPAPKAIKQETAALNERELVSLYALLAYTAYDRKISEDSVHKAVSHHYGINDIKHLPGSAFESAIRFLIDFQGDMLLS